MADLKKLAQGRTAYKRTADKTADAKPQKTLEETCRAEVDEIQAAFRERMAREDSRKRITLDSEFWFSVYFESREDKERFLRKWKLDMIGDKYLSGRKVDRHLSRAIKVVYREKGEKP